MLTMKKKLVCGWYLALYLQFLSDVLIPFLLVNLSTVNNNSFDTVYCTCNCLFKLVLYYQKASLG